MGAVIPVTRARIKSANANTDALQRARRLTQYARFNNPRLRPVMASPPTITTGTSLPSGQSNQFAWNGSRASAINLYSGQSSSLAGYRGCLGSTVSGVRNSGHSRIEFNTDAAKVTLNFFGLDSTGAYRFIIDGQYASLAATAPGLSGSHFVTLDFTGFTTPFGGANAVKNIVVELTSLFGSVYVGATETVFKPPGDVVSMSVLGDSYTADAGATFPFNGFRHVMGDMLGIRDVRGLGIGSTGYLATASGTQLTARGRIPDVVFANADIVAICMGHNDAAFLAGLPAELALFFPALRAAVPTKPIIVFGTFNGNQTTALLPVEAAILAAFTAWADPLSYYIPVTNAAQGAPFTGTGFITTPAGNGNCDRDIATDNVHPNDSGHMVLGAFNTDALISQILPAA